MYMPKLIFSSNMLTKMYNNKLHSIDINKAIAQKRLLLYTPKGSTTKTAVIRKDNKNVPGSPIVSVIEGLTMKNK